MKVQIAGKTDIGKKRKHNEDNLLIEEKHNLFLVCDGMGGHNAGEIASKHACETIKEFFLDFTNKININLDEQFTILPQDSRGFITAIQLSNQRIFQDSQINRKRKGMGTTIAGLLINQNGYATIVNVGDSRVYRLRGNHFEQLTQDHTWLNELFEDGEISEKEATNSSEKNVITRALGIAPKVKIDVRLEPIQEKDIFLICSDGLSGPVSDEEIKNVILGFRNNLKDACSVLIETANNLGGPDNISVILVEIKEISDSVVPTKITLEESEQDLQRIEKFMEKRYKLRERKIPLYIPILFVFILVSIFLAFFINRQKEMSKPPPPSSCKLEIKTMPDSAQISLDDKEFATPCTIPNLLPASIHKIIIKKEGYLPVGTVIHVPKDTIDSQTFTLEPEAEIIKITYYNDSKAELFIDGVRKGVLESLEIKPIPVSKGVHNFEVKLKNRIIFHKTYEVKIGDKITIDHEQRQEKERFRIKKPNE